MASVKRKERYLKELYTVTQMITEPKITPVLGGSYRMQGPVDEIDCDIPTKMVKSLDEKGLSMHCKSWKASMRAESGTCNVCSAPCSSCLHINRALMKTDEFSDETSEGNAGSQYSVNDAVPVKTTACESGQNTASETSNLLSVNSNHDSFSENAESKASLRTCDVSGGSEDAEMHRNLSSGVTAGDNQLNFKPQHNCDQRALTNTLENQKVLEGHGDSISCVSGGNDTEKVGSHKDGNVVRKDVPHGTVSVALYSHKIDWVEIPSSEDRIEGVSSLNPNAREVKEDLGSHPPLELSKFLKEHLNSALTKEAASDMVGCREIDDGCVVEGNSASSPKLCLNFEAETETDKGGGDLPTEAANSAAEHSQEIEKVKETSLNSCPIDDSDGSDILEHDVKVCDICGDAGREDLLAICIRCSDGAEHTYCMREMLDKVPEGDWLCEECKFDEQFKNLKQDETVKVDGNDKRQSSGQTSALNSNISVKLERKDSYVEGNKTHKDIASEKASSKRRSADIEVASAVKRQALDPTVGSPKASSPSRLAALSRVSSFKNLDKGKVKPAHQLSSGTCATNDASKAALTPVCPRLQTPQRSLTKSNSFNSTNTTRKVKLVEEVVLQRQKSARETTSLDMKEAAVKLIGKSRSFKSLNVGRSNPAESKVKMLSPKFSHGQDLKGSKQAKEWTLLERKNSFRSERSLVGSAMGNGTVSMSRGDKKVASYAESYSLPSVSNSRELKSVQSDSKVSTLSKSTGHVTRRGSDMQVPSGGIKGQSCSHGVAEDSSTKGISNSAEHKPTLIGLMQDPSSSTLTAEKPFCNANEGLPDVLSRPTESTNLGERIRESSVINSRTSITAGGRSASCKKLEEIGNSSESCTVENPLSPLRDVSASRSSRAVVDKGSKLKAAIEAAMLKKPGIYRKNKMPDQSDKSMSNTSLNCEIRPQDQVSTSVNSRNAFAADEVHEGQAVLQNSTAEPWGQTTLNNVKLLSALSSEAANLKNADGPIDPSVGKHIIRDLPSHASTAVSVLLKMSIVPEHEYIWQGGFNVQKSGKRPQLHDGIQAHLSTCASPKVLAVVNKFPSSIFLNELPRLSTWPLQFQEIGVKEENIALYFFAKDLGSYEKSYKCLLETMMKNDLALKGNFDGVELLIFSSNHLPEKSQRWNTLYFLWGVFRGRKANCLQDVSGSPKKHFIPRDLNTAAISLPESTCTLGPIDGELPTCSKAYNFALPSDCPSLMKSPRLSSETTKEVYDLNASSLDPKSPCTQANEGQKDYNLDATSLPGIQRTSAVSFQETRCISTPLEQNFDPESKLDAKPQSSVQAAGTSSDFKKSDKMPAYGDNAPDHQQTLFSFTAHGSVSSSKILGMIERTLKEEEGSLDTQAVHQRHQVMRDWTVKELNHREYNNGKRLHEDSTWTVSQASSCNDVTSELLDEGGASKKRKTDCSGLFVRYGSSNSGSLRESFASGIDHDVGTSSPIKEEIRDNTKVSGNNGTAERYLFPVDPDPPVKDLSSGGNSSVPWKVFSSEDDDRLPDDGVPNLELALGADMVKPSKPGGMRSLPLPFLVEKVNLNDDLHDQPAEEKEEDDISACLSLSLSFPFPDKEKRTGKSAASKAEQLLPDRQHVNTSLLLFDGLLKK